jgi:hypothetical protein
MLVFSLNAFDDETKFEKVLHRQQFLLQYAQAFFAKPKRKETRVIFQPPLVEARKSTSLSLDAIGKSGSQAFKGSLQLRETARSQSLVSFIAERAHPSNTPNLSKPKI